VQATGLTQFNSRNCGKLESDSKSLIFEQSSKLIDESKLRDRSGFMKITLEHPFRTIEFSETSSLKGLRLVMFSQKESSNLFRFDRLLNIERSVIFLQDIKSNLIRLFKSFNIDKSLILLQYDKIR
jgi:hypothetical protein